MSVSLKKALAALSCIVAVTVGADAISQPALVQTPPVAVRTPLSDSDGATLNAIITAAKRGDGARIRVLMVSVNDPIARKIALWALADAAPQSLSFIEADSARRDLAGWPKATGRQIAAEKLLETAGMGPAAIIAWFGESPPETAEGAMALASALRASNRAADAATLIRKVWREKLFGQDVQKQMLARFGDVLTIEDHRARLDALLYGPQGPAARDMIDLVPDADKALALARIAFRSNAGNAGALAAALPADQATNPGLTFERVAYYRRSGRNDMAISLLGGMPRALPHDDAATRMWKERYPLVLYALRNGNSQGAYAAAANSGITKGGDAADAEFYAGWIALTRLRNPQLADKHFANLQAIGSSPITQGRALYWRGRAAEAMGDPVNAQIFYAQGARFPTAFYGQLAAAKAGVGLDLGRDPEITQADRSRFEAREIIQAARDLAEIGARDQFRAFVLAADDILPNAAEEALLVDLARGYGDQDLGMRVVRTAATRGFVLPERGYPFRTPPAGVSAPETALIYGIIRQESGFDPRVRSPVGATGLMQLMPGTAAVVARRMGVGYNLSQLYDPDYNMRLGSSYLAQMVDNFGGSYVMAVAAYNAGPGRPPEWASFCGDPRGAAGDPIDFIECIPFSETRNYVMRVMEGMQVYRARLNGGKAPVMLANDLQRGVFGYTPAPSATPPAYTTPTAPPASGRPATMQPIPD